MVKPDGQEAKVAAIGVRVRRWVTFHGIAINLDPDLSHFAAIVPCGLRNFGVTSIADLGRKATMSELDEVMISPSRVFSEARAPSDRVERQRKGRTDIIIPGSGLSTKAAATSTNVQSPQDGRHGANPPCLRLSGRRSQPLQIRTAACRLARPDAEGAFDRRQSLSRKDQQTRRLCPPLLVRGTRAVVSAHRKRA